MDNFQEELMTRSERKALTALNVNNMSNGKRCLSSKKINLVQHEYNCVQICEPLTMEDIQSAKSQEIEQIDGIQSVNKNLLISIIEENKQLQNKMKEIVKNVVKINNKFIEIKA